MTINDNDTPKPRRASIFPSEVQADIIARALMKSYGVGRELELSNDLPYDVQAVVSALERNGCIVQWNSNRSIAFVRRGGLLDEGFVRPPQMSRSLVPWTRAVR